MINLLSCIKYLKLIVLDVYIFYYIMRNDRNNVKQLQKLFIEWFLVIVLYLNIKFNRKKYES